jgi:hypothetical protein
MTEFLDNQRQHIRERIEFIEPLVDELPVLRKTLAALNGREYVSESDALREAVESLSKTVLLLSDRISQLESEDKDEHKGAAKTQEGGPAEAEAAPPDTNGSSRKPATKVRVEQIRDWVVGQSEPFSVPDVARAFDIARTTAAAKLDELPDGMIRRPPGSPSMGPTARWEYVPPDPRQSPRRRPRGEDKGPRERSRIDGVLPVAHTGRPKGPSDKASDRKAGTLVRRKKGGKVMRVGAGKR